MAWETETMPKQGRGGRQGRVGSILANHLGEEGDEVRTNPLQNHLRDGDLAGASATGNANDDGPSSGSCSPFRTAARQVHGHVVEQGFGVLVEVRQPGGHNMV